MRTYFIDFYKIAKDLLYHFLQEKGILAYVTSDPFFWVTASGLTWNTGSATRHLDWLKSLVKPLGSLNQTFQEYVADVRYRMYLTGQIIYLEHYLNDLFDPVLRRIYIEDGDAGTPLFLYLKVDNKPIFIYNKSEGETAPFLYNKADLEGDDFIVIVPWSNFPVSESFKMKANINIYKTAGRRYSIQTTPGGPAYP